MSSGHARLLRCVHSSSSLGVREEISSILASSYEELLGSRECVSIFADYRIWKIPFLMHVADYDGFI